MERLLDNRTGKESTLRTNFSYCKKDCFLIFEFEAKDSALNSYSNENNDEQYKGDVCEVFLDVGEEEYYEFEVAPNGTTFVAKIINGTPYFIDSSFFMSVVEKGFRSYKVKMVIDLTRFMPLETLKFNAFRIETKGVRQDLILQAYSPTLSNTFHVRECFVNIPLL